MELGHYLTIAVFVLGMIAFPLVRTAFSQADRATRLESRVDAQDREIRDLKRDGETNRAAIDEIRRGNTTILERLAEIRTELRMGRKGDS